MAGVNYFRVLMALLVCTTLTFTLVSACKNKPKSRPRSNSYPSISCPSSQTVYASSGRTSAYVSYSTPTARDPEDGTLSVHRYEGKGSGNWFSEGTHTIKYKTVDSRGAADYCSFQITVKVHRCSSSYTSLSYGSASCTYNYLYGSTCRYSCDTGYYLSGSSSSECLSYGSWSNSLPTCRIRECSSSWNYLSHGTARCNGRTYRNTCSYSCDSGYVLSGYSSTTCQSSGSWSYSKPTCKPVECGSPPVVEFSAAPSCTSHTYQGKCLMACKDGFKMVQGNNDVTCGANGQWSSPGKCVDVQPPKVTCVNDITADAGFQGSPVQVQFELPDVIDNSGADLTAACDHDSNSTFSPGVTTITCTAVDTAKNVGQCTFMISITEIQCPDFETPENSNSTCSHENVYGSECTVTCQQGYDVEGEATHTCTENQTWSGEQSVCKRLSCSPPPQIPDGKYECPSGVQYQDSCFLVCDAGFEPLAPFNTTCNIDIEWTELGSCNDVEPPIFPNGCPAEMNVNAASLGEPTYVTYSLPQATDNSGETPTVTGDPISGSVFDEGMTVVTITAFDSVGNNNSCQFTVNVEDISCEAPSLDTTGKDLIAYDCPHDHVFGAQCSLSCSDGNPLTGPASIKCDKNQNSDELEWTWSGTVRPYCDATKCRRLIAPKNGALSCEMFGETSEVCYLQCNEGFLYPPTSPVEYTCFATGSWLPREYVPDCVARRKPNAPFTKPSFYYFADNCSSSTDEIRENFLQAFSSSNYRSICNDGRSCNISDVSVTCGHVGERKRRSIYGEQEAEAEKPFEIEIVPKISMDFEDKDTLEFYTHMATELNKLLKSESESGVFDFDMIGQFAGFYMGTSDFDCDPGTKFVGETMACVGCGEGHSYNNDTHDCDICPRGSYQDQEISFSCIPCPTGKSTKHAGATALQQCQDMTE